MLHLQNSWCLCLSGAICHRIQVHEVLIQEEAKYLKTIAWLVYGQALGLIALYASPGVFSLRLSR
jgi:hypothetical protein